jgi:hypothetical protein
VPGPPSADRTPPRILSLSVSPRRPRAGSTAAITAALTEDAAVVATLSRLLPGMKRGGRCVAARSWQRVPRARRCTRAKDVGRATGTARAGTAALRLTLRRAAKPLAAGRHRIVVDAVDAAGNRSAPARRTVVVRRR